MAQFFHPSAKIRDHFPQNDKRRLTGVVVMGEGVRRIQNKDQMCYLVRIDEVDDGTIFFISKKNFKVDTPAAIPFESEALAQPVRGHDALVRDQLRAAGANVVPNVGTLSRGATREEIEELRQNGIEVDNDNKPAPENATPQEIPPLLAHGRSRSTATVGLIPNSPTLPGDSSITGGIRLLTTTSLTSSECASRRTTFATL